MPSFVCDECDEVFGSKDALKEHVANHTESAGQALDVSLPDLNLSAQNLRSKFTARNAAIIFGVVMMGTLFLGPVLSFAPTGTPNSGGGGSGGGSETNPPAGFSIQSQADVPRVSNSALPTSSSVSAPLSQDVQLNLLLRGGQQNQPGILFQYNCPNGCAETVSQLESLANEYSGWVYVAPYPDMDTQIALTGFRNIDKMDAFDRQRAETFICDTYGQLNTGGPVACAVN